MALQERTPLCLCEVDTLKDKALQRCQSRHLVGCTFQNFLDADDGDDQPAAPQPGQKPPGRRRAIQ